MLRCKIENKNDEEYFDISDGAVFTENYNETLDSGTILLQQLSSKIDIEPYDVVVIDDTNNDIKINSRRMCVDTYTCTQTSLNPPIYKYEISLFSETKLLEGVILPSLTITKPLNNNTPSIPVMITRYLEMFAPKKLLNGEYVRKWSLSNRVLSRFQLINCPEMQWNQPTLREVINDLMMVEDCIPVLKNNEIDYICISDIGNEITNTQKEGINYIQESQSAEDYVSELKMNLVNVANNDNIENNATVVERISFRNNETYLLTTENLIAQTTFPIWKIFKCNMYVNTTVTIQYLPEGQSNPMYVTTTLMPVCDLTDYILEYKEWLTKDVFYGAWGSYASGLNTDYRNTCLYYIRGAKNVVNFGDKYQWDWLFIHEDVSVLSLITIQPDFQSSLRGLAEDYINENYPDASYGGYTGTTCNFFKSEIELKYESLDQCVFMATKTPFPIHQRHVVDNQTNSYVDINRQGMLEYLKANRLGNKLNVVNGRYYTNESLIPALSEKINDKIIFKKEISVYNNYVNVNYQTVANYVLQNYFTSVKSKLRSWRVVSGEEAFLRSDIIKFYISPQILSYSKVYNDKVYFIFPANTNMQWYLYNFKYCAIQFNKYTLREDDLDFNSGVIPNGSNFLYDGVNYNVNGILKEFTKHIIYDEENNIKTILFTIKMNDNRFDGNYVSDFEAPVPNDQHATRVEQKGIGYTDDDGEVYGAYICFYNRYNGLSLGNLDNADADTGLKPLINIGTDPRALHISGRTLNSNDLVAKIPVILHKDNKEITQITIQIEYNAEANDIFLGKVHN